MKKILFTLLSLILVLIADLSAELQNINASLIDIAAVNENLPLPVPAPYKGTSAAQEKQASSFAVYQVNGVDVIVPHIGCGNDLLAVLRPGDKPGDLAARLRQAFASAAGAKAVAVQPRSKAELELAAQNPGASIVSLNQFLPANAAALFNRP